MKSSRAHPVGSKMRRDVGVGLCDQGVVSGGFPAPGQQLVHPCVRQLGEAGEGADEPGTDERGLSLVLTPTYGATGGDAAKLWLLRDPRELTLGEAEERHKRGSRAKLKRPGTSTGCRRGRGAIGRAT